MPPAISKPLQMLAIRSSSLAQVVYDCHQLVLHVHFRDGSAYEYRNVPHQAYLDLMRADSKGAYFNRHIRNRYPQIKMSDP